jgi:hypothetical protein
MDRLDQVLDSVLAAIGSAVSGARKAVEAEAVRDAQEYANVAETLSRVVDRLKPDPLP